jgi:hypothetical protein
VGYSQLDSYAAYGPFRWIGNNVISPLSNEDSSALTNGNAPFRWSHLRVHISDLANIKLGYIWPQDAGYGPNRKLPLYVDGYRNQADKDAGRKAWHIKLVKDYHFWFDGPNLYRAIPPTNMFYLEDGVNTTSDDLVLRVSDQGNGTTIVTYISQATLNWIYDVVAEDGTLVLEGLGQGVNKGKTGVYSTEVPTPPNTVVKPRWITDYPSAKAIFDTGTQTLVGSAWLQVILTHTVTTTPNADPNGSPTVSDSGETWKDTRLRWQYVPDNNNNVNNVKFFIVPPGLDDPKYLVDNNIWLDDVAAPAVVDPKTGVSTQRFTANYYVFLGINVGTPVPVRNPANWVDRSALPAPIDIDHTQVQPQTDSRRQYLTFLGAARRGDTALMWPDRFSSNKPDPSMVALAQTQVFNDHSFDLWTPMWQSQVERITNMPDWLVQCQNAQGQLADLGSGQANGGIPSVPSAQMVTAQEMADLQTYINALLPMADVGLSH